MLRESPSTEPPRDAGSAALEFILVGLILLVPIVYLIVALGAIQEQALGVEAGARHLARTIASADDAASADASAERVLASIAAEYGIDREALTIEITCSGSSTCPEAGATLLVTLSTRVALPLVPSVLGLDTAASVPVTATGVQKVSRYWSAP